MSMKKDMFFYSGPLIFQRAKQLRYNLTDAEMRLWGYLRSKPFGDKFRRQHPLGNYLVDFYCDALGLVIEVDDSIDDHEEAKAADRERQIFIEMEHIRVVRFTNYQVSNQYEETIASINGILVETTKQIPPLGG
jgi:cyclase